MKRLQTTLLALALASLGAGLKAEQYRSSIYLLGGIDAKMLTNQDASNYFNLSGQLGPQGYPGLVAHLGIQLPRWMALEASLSQGPARSYDVRYENGVLGTTRQVTTRWNLSTLSLTPALTWVGPGWVNLLGLRVGQATFAGRVVDNAWGSSGSYDQEAQVMDFGLIYRSSAIVAGHFSLGLEFGYDWTMFTDIKNKNGSGSYDPVHSPERNISGLGHNGDKTTLDFSGAHVALVVGLWSGPPVE